VISFFISFPPEAAAAESRRMKRRQGASSFFRILSRLPRQNNIAFGARPRPRGFCA
jgi:hypothetical protein